MAIFHLNASTGTILGGQSAAAHCDYIARCGKYSLRGDRLEFLESVNMPRWAASTATAIDYWRAADAHERANGRLYKSLEFSLPVELGLEEQIKLARKFAQEICETKDGRLPHTFALHAGKGHNPHCHLMISERVVDEHERCPDRWFKRASAKGKEPADGGSRKTGLLKPREWLEFVRARWADLVNQALLQAGIDSRVDHRSNKAQGIAKTPGQHVGPIALAIGRKYRSGLVSKKNLAVFNQLAAQSIDLQIRRVESELQLVYAQVEPPLLPSLANLLQLERKRAVRPQILKAKRPINEKEYTPDR